MVLTQAGGGNSGNTSGGSSSGSSEQTPEGFVKVPAASINGTESWTPASEVFVSGRKLEIASFYMSDHEVTRGEYKSLMGSDPSRFKDGAADGEVQENRPVEQVSWYDALVYCNKRSIAEGLTPCYTISSSTDPST
nr:SUMF1/EgtB/PvdO family nonheme iron enzyme [uncultured Treponema sp.]